MRDKPTPNKCYWKGKDMDYLTREEAIEAAKILGQELQAAWRSFEAMGNIDNAIMQERKRRWVG